MTQESKRLKSGEEHKLELAVQSKIIKTAAVDEIVQVLRLVMVKIGLRAQNFPSAEETSVLLAHIIENFPGNRVEEIKLAFDMCISGKLDLDTADTKCYENFSCLYFTTVMSSYQRWASQAIVHIKPKEMPEQKIFTDKELEDSQREDAERQYQLFLKNIPPRSTEINKAILEKDNIINKAETVLELFKRKKDAGYKNIYIKQ